MKQYLSYLRLVSLFICCCFAGLNTSFASSEVQSGCSAQVVVDSEVVANQSLDVNQDGKQDQVILYGKDNLKIAVVLSQATESCEVVLNEYISALKLVNPTIWRTVRIRQIEMIELTGDDKPELHIWLEITEAPARYEQAIHAIYTFSNGRLREIFRSGHCLVFSSFEFRDGPDKEVKDIYVDSDLDCQPPLSFSRTYTVMRWNGSEYAKSESGTINTFTVYPSWLTAFFTTSLLCVALILILTVTRLRKKQQR